MTCITNDPKAPSKTFCILPWVQLYARPDGTLSPCCIADWQAHTDANQKTNPHILYSPQGLEESWNSERMRELRLAMLEGRSAPECGRCYREERFSMRSQRQNFNDLFAEHITKAVEATASDGSSPVELMNSVDLRLGNLCNLRCRMCSPESSKALIKEWVHLKGMAEDDPRIEPLKHLEWVNNDDFWRGLERHVSHIETFFFAGGEPMIIPQVMDFLERVVSMGYAQNIVLNLISNFTLLPQRMLALWPHFKTVRLVASLDGFGEINSFIRHPSKWATIDRNLKDIDGRAERLNVSSLIINTTVQLYNIFRLDELIEYVATSFEHVPLPHLGLLTEPQHFNIRALPPEMKRQAEDRLRRFTERFTTRWPARWQDKHREAFHARIDGIIAHMMSADRSGLLAEFRRWTEHMDKTRRQNILAAIPELGPLFTSASAA